MPGQPIEGEASTRMVQRRSISAVVVSAAAAMLAVAGCSGAPAPNPSDRPVAFRQAPASASSSSSVPPSSSTRPAPGHPKLTLAQAVGQRIIYSYPGATPPASLLSKIKAGEVAGVIFFGENITSTSQITGVIKQLDAANAQSPVHEPLLLMTDQEGGQVRRLPGEPVLSAKQDGAAADPVATSRKSGLGAGRNLAGVGMNLNLAPVLDVFRKPGDFADKPQRSFSNDPAQVAADATAYSQGQQSVHIASTAKHFPGLGATPAGQNTDLGPVTLNQPLSQLRAVDELPYSKIIGSGVNLVMASWAVYPALDSKYPAGLSAKIINGELRGRLGFKGVTITDALEAAALKAFGSDAQRGVAAAGAGMDLILASARDVNQGDQVAAALTAALQSGKLDKAQFDASVGRISALRSGLASHGHR